MKLRFFFTVSLVVFLSTTSFSQEKLIRANFYDYINTLISGDYERSMDYIADDFFEIISRDQLAQVLHMTFNNPQIELKLSNPEIMEVGEIKLIEGKYYAPLMYSNTINMKFLMPEGEEESADAQELRIQMTRASLEQTFGKENVTFNEDTDFFEVYSEKLVYSISGDGKSGWKFIAVEKQQKEMLKQILPKELIDKI